MNKSEYLEDALEEILKVYNKGSWRHQDIAARMAEVAERVLYETANHPTEFET